MYSGQPQTTKTKSENSESSSFKFGPLRGRPEFFYEHVPLCPEDPNCFRSTCGYCHPRRDSQNTHWSWVYPIEKSQDTKPVRSAVPPLLYGKQYENVEPTSLSRESSSFEDSFLLPNFDFLDTDPPHNPWDFKSSDLKSDGPPLRKNDSNKSLNKEAKTKKRVRSVLRTDAIPFLPRVSPSASPVKAPLEVAKPSSPPTIVTKEEKIVIPESGDKSVTVVEKKVEETPQAAFLRRMELIKKAAVKPTPTPAAQIVAEPPKVAEMDTNQPIGPSSQVPSTTKVVVSKSKAIPMVPPFKPKITTHTRTEQESLAPLLPLRGGSMTSTQVIESPTMSPTQKSIGLKNLSGLQAEQEDDETQILDTGAKAPDRRWFMVLWAFVCSWVTDLAQDTKGIILLLWATIIARLPYFRSSSSKATKITTSAPTTRNQIKKPTPLKHVKPIRAVKSELNDGKMRK